MAQKSAGGANKARTATEEVFDPEGWMSERPTYWIDLEPPEAPTRAAWLRHRAREFATWLHLAERKRDPQITEEEWIRLSEQALGPLPRPTPPPKKAARSAKPNAPKTARKPPASSQAARPSRATR